MNHEQFLEKFLNNLDNIALKSKDGEEEKDVREFFENSDSHVLNRLDEKRYKLKFSK